MEVQGRRKRGGNGSIREKGYVGRRETGMKVQGRRKTGALHRKEGDGNGSTGEKEEKKSTT